MNNIVCKTPYLLMLSDMCLTGEQCVYVRGSMLTKVVYYLGC